MDNFGRLESEGHSTSLTEWSEMTNNTVFNPRNNYLPGFEVLDGTEKVFLERNLDPTRARRTWHAYKKNYKAMNENGVELFNIIQDPGGDCYCCCMDSLTTFRAIGKFERELFKVTYGFSEFSKKLALVHDRNEELLGGVRSIGKFCQMIYSIRDRDEVDILRIARSTCWGMGPDFHVTNLSDDTKTGVISKKPNGLPVQHYKLGQTLAVCFPKDLDVKFKAVLIGLVLYLDFYCYRRERHHVPIDTKLLLLGCCLANAT